MLPYSTARYWAYNTLRWMAIMSGSQTLRQWEPETIRTYLVRVAGKLLTGNRQLTVKNTRQSSLSSGLG